MVDPCIRVERFAKALDNEDYAAAKLLLADDCIYECRGELYVGPSAIVASYEKHGNEAESFDTVDYESSVVVDQPGRFRIQFSDHLSHAGRAFTFRCGQLIEFNAAGKIVRIQHVDLPGQMEALSEFKTLVFNQNKDIG